MAGRYRLGVEAQPSFQTRSLLAVPVKQTCKGEQHRDTSLADWPTKEKISHFDIPLREQLRSFLRVLGDRVPTSPSVRGERA